MMTLRNSLFFFCWLGFQTYIHAQVQEDKIFSPTIHTILLYPENLSNDVIVLPSVIELNRGTLIIEFDDLVDQAENYYLALEHCRMDWQSSGLNDLEFMQDFNEMRITEYEYSFNTRVNYVHYKARLPRVKISGNYILKVYRDGQKTRPAFTRRFIVYENRIVLSAEAVVSQNPADRFTHQQVNFEIFYKGLDIINPQQSVSVTLRQNYRWDTALQGLLPTQTNEIEKKLYYRFFNQENTFKGGNEFRFFETSTVNSTGLGVAKVQTDSLYHFWLFPDKRREREPYSRQLDANGGFLVSHYESGQPATGADYVWVHFALATPSMEQPIHVLGHFNFFQTSKENKMRYDATQNIYHTSLLLKQGIYNYQYGLSTPKGIDASSIEGNYSNTENMYDIIVYYRAFGSRYDSIIYYKTLKL